LGSSSKWRQKLLKQFGVADFITISPDINEKAIRHQDPEQLTLLVAKAKAQALLERLSSQPPSPNNSSGYLLLTSDQVLCFDGQLREKPENIEQAKFFLRSYSNRSVESYTAVVLTNTKTGQQFEAVDKAIVHFSSISEETVEELIQKGEVFCCAGALIVEDPLFSKVIVGFEGESESVQGLPRCLTLHLLQQANPDYKF